ncbi:MAG: ABC1 kinase family protein [Acidimicrobiia bacterium]
MSTVPASDLELGSFDENGPWVIDLDDLPWRRGLDRVRSALKASVPAMTRPSKLPPVGRMAATVHRMGAALGPWAVRDRGTDRSVAGLFRRLRIAAERLGPTYIKLGQIISAGEGIFPPELVAEFRKCRDQVPPETFAVVRQVVEEDLGRPLEEVFRSFDREPLAAASVAQVHPATLASGEDVVVKVQRPGVSALVGRDLKVMAWVAPKLVGRIPVSALANPPALVELFAETIAEELDFRLEAENMLDVARTFAELGQRAFVVPRPHPRLVTRRVLVMERLFGFGFEDVAAMVEAGIDTKALIRDGMTAFMEGAMIKGVFHGDLHGGNLFIRPDGRAALLDFGITGRLPDQRRMAFLRLLIGASTNDVKSQLAALRDLGALPADSDLDEVMRELHLDRPPVDPTTLTREEMVAEIQRTVRALMGFGAKLPKELMLLIKNLVFLDGAIATLAPDLDLLGEIAHLLTHFATVHGERLAVEIGHDRARWKLDMTGIKGVYMVDQSVDSLTYKELQERRKLIAKRFEKDRSPKRWRRKSR